MATSREREIREQLPAEVDGALDKLELFPEIDSTNSYLLEQPAPDVERWHVAIADRQTAGRGRGDNRWHSPAGGGLWMSGAYTFAALPDNLSALTLAVGVGTADSLRALGLDDVRLKWPNDLLVGRRKLGGILLDSSRAGASNLTVVCGVGINVDLGEKSKASAMAANDNSLEPVDLTESLATVPPMHELAATFIGSLVASVTRYADEGIVAFIEGWQRYDCLRGRRISVKQHEQTLIGVADGIAANGALILNDGGERHHIVSGTVRPLDDGDTA